MLIAELGLTIPACATLLDRQAGERQVAGNPPKPQVASSSAMARLLTQYPTPKECVCWQECQIQQLVKLMATAGSRGSGKQSITLHSQAHWLYAVQATAWDSHPLWPAVTRQAPAGSKSVAQLKMCTAAAVQIRLQQLVRCLLATTKSTAVTPAQPQIEPWCSQGIKLSKRSSQEINLTNTAQQRSMSMTQPRVRLRTCSG
jgi:hypothetical protein